MAQGAAYSFTPTAEDADGDPLTFAITNWPSWASFDTTTGALTGTPANDDVGNYEDIVITVTDTDGLNDSLAAFNIEVTNVNDAPTGLPAISGTVTLGETLTAGIDDIGDVDGLPDSSTFEYQWQADDIRVSMAGGRHKY